MQLREQVFSKRFVTIVDSHLTQIQENPNEGSKTPLRASMGERRDDCELK